MTGLEGPSASVAFAQAFPQPDDASDEESLAGPQVEITEAEDEGEASDGEASKAASSGKTKGNEQGRRSLLRPGSSKERHKSNSQDSATESKVSRSKKRSSFVTAPLKRKPFSGDSAASPPPSFHTARASPESSEQVEDQDGQLSKQNADNGDQPRSSNTDSVPFTTEGNSRTALISNTNAENDRTSPGEDIQVQESGPIHKSESPGLIKFNTKDQPNRSKSIAFADQDAPGRRHTFRRARHRDDHRGEIVKMEKMLVRVDATVQELPSDYNENDSAKIEARCVDKWREFVVVCRQSTSEDEEFSLQLYKTRVIPARADTHVQGRSTHEIPLSHRKTKVNLYSSLDKTLVIWMPSKGGSRIFILRSRSAASAVEWYTFIRQCLGWKRSVNLQVNVPDLSVSLQLENPFGELEGFISEAGESQDASLKTIEAERAVANSIIQKCVNVLEGNPEWSNVLETWLAQERIGLAWKRYDRLEWVHGANEKRMYGTIAMQRTHELELRVKDHYPTSVRAKTEGLVEPSPVEGFLIRLTSQKGNVRRLGRMYYKRLYFTTHNHYLCYCRPARAEPPPPPNLGEKTDFKVPSASEIVDNSPLIYAVDPFPMDNGQIEWLKQGRNRAADRKHDHEAYKESERKINSLLKAEGYMNLLHVLRVQNTERGNSVADDSVDQGSDVDFHEEVPNTPRNDGKVATFDDERTFEIVMRNKLVIRLQAYDEQTKREWIHRLRMLVRYWKLRLKDDMQLLKSVRDENLEKLGIDEEMEATLGQYASKWEVSRSVASPKLFNMCGISCCRAITKAGTLYHKPKRRSTFLRSGVILCHGKLLIFQGTLRKRTGEEQPHIQHNRHSVLDLRDCYIYSGLLTEGDLLYQNKTFDANHPGHSALPKFYREDGWTSIDEDTMTCFVVWQPRNKSWFKASEQDAGAGRTQQKLRHVSRLGAAGRSIVFKARSRTERDHWVTSIALEVERMQGGDDIRVVNK